MLVIDYIRTKVGVENTTATQALFLGITGEIFAAIDEEKMKKKAARVAQRRAAEGQQLQQNVAQAAINVQDGDD